MWFCLVLLVLLVFFLLNVTNNKPKKHKDKRSVFRMMPLFNLCQMRHFAKPIRIRIILFFLNLFNIAFFDAILFANINPENAPSDYIFTIAFATLLISFPFNYIFGKFSLWATTLENEEEI